MNLVIDNWTSEDIDNFHEYEKSFLGDEKACEWEQKIVNTKLKCFGKTSSKAKILVKEIKKGNFISFLNTIKIENHLDSLVCAFLINSIKDFDLFNSELNKFVLTIDNWASTDTLSYKKQDKDKLFELSKQYLKSNKPFVRRTGINIYFELIKDKKFLSSTFKMFDSLKNENEYYVNMCASWLLAECFAKYRAETFKYFKSNKTNSFIINKAISKCRDSFRVSKEDKDLLLKFRQNK